MTQSSTQLFRRGVVLPKTREAMLAIQADSIKDETLFLVASFSDDDQFYRVWETGVFLEINHRCNLMIDDYEETEVKNSLGEIASLIEQTSQDGRLLKEDRDLLERMRDLALQAKNNNTSLFFIF